MAQNGIIPVVNYGEYSNQKPDSIIIRRQPLQVFAVGERKAPGILTPDNWTELANDLLRTKAHPLNARLAFLTDGVQTYWLNGQATVPALIRYESGEPLPARAVFTDHDTQLFCLSTFARLETQTGIIRKDVPLDPRRLAEQVWQTVWRVSGKEPQECLATFVELFVYKFLDDLKLMDKTSSGKRTDVDYLLTLGPEVVLRYYQEEVRPYVKLLFPTGQDGYSVINGIVLKGSNEDHNVIFRELLQKFVSFGSLTNITKDFKTKLYESFLKESRTTSEFGQFFTPRNVVSCMYDLADVENLTPDSVILDPACGVGVGGFLLEAFARDVAGQWITGPHTVKPRQKWIGYDRDKKTTILAKANALVHCGQILANKPTRVKTFAKWLNSVFHCDETKGIGSLHRLEKETADLILTNPPYVVSGAKDFKKLVRGNNKYRKYFECPSTGVEGLFAQFIVKALKENGRAFVLLPETLLLRTTDRRLRRWLLEHCRIDLLSVLPENTFYNTPKRVVLVGLTKRRKTSPYAAELAGERTLLTMVSEIGETRDVKRFPCRTDLLDLVAQFKMFRAKPLGFVSSLRFKTVKSDELYKTDIWFVPQWWTEAERVELGTLQKAQTAEEQLATTTENLISLQEQVAAATELVKALAIPTAPPDWIEVSLGDKKLFSTKIGKRVLKKTVYQIEEGIPLYSANVRNPFGYVQKANAGGLAKGGCLWSIDSDFDVREVTPEEVYYITDHCGELRILGDDIDPVFLARQVRRAGIVKGFARDYRSSLDNMRKLAIRLPARTVDGTKVPDLNMQQQWGTFYKQLDNPLSGTPHLEVFESWDAASAPPPQSHP